MGFVLAVIATIFTVAAALPGRAGFAVNESLYGTPVWANLIMGVARDTIYTSAMFWMILLLWFSGCSRGPSRKSSEVYGSIGFLLMFVVVMFSLMAAAEFKTQRGVYPTWSDLVIGASHHSFFTSSLPYFFAPHYSLTLIFALILGGGCLIAFRRSLSHTNKAAPLNLPYVFSSSFFGILLLCIMSFQVVRLLPYRVKSIDDRGRYQSPVEAFGSSFTKAISIHHRGLRYLFGTLDARINEKVAGARMLGLPYQESLMGHDPATGFCTRHPLRVSLDHFHPHGDNIATPDAMAQLRFWLSELSRSLFDHRQAPIHLWQIALESFRGDDIQGINPNAPDFVTPFVNALYRAAASGSAYEDSQANLKLHTIASPKTYQAGMRSAQGINALLCGLGTLPYNISIGRDLGLLPLRCLPDVLSDSGFRATSYLGTTMSFDNLREFYNYHGFETFDERDMPKLERGTWGISDKAFYRWLLQHHLQNHSGQSSSYNFAFAMSGHPPYMVPNDFPEELYRKVRNEIEKLKPLPLTSETRLAVWAYVDYALKDFVNILSEHSRLADTIIVASADHSVNDVLLWDSPNLQHQKKAMALIPFFIIIPDALMQSASDTNRAQLALSKINELLHSYPLSQNDIPLIILTLLSASPEVRSLQDEWRWHTIGGQRMSGAAVDALSDARIWGIDVISDLFFVSDDDIILPTQEKIENLFERDESKSRTSRLHPISSIISDLVRYADQCSQRQHFRKAAGG
jgi:hypothetical protein